MASPYSYDTLIARIWPRRTAGRPSCRRFWHARRHPAGPHRSAGYHQVAAWSGRSPAPRLRTRQNSPCAPRLRHSRSSGSHSVFIKPSGTVSGGATKRTPIRSMRGDYMTMIAWSVDVQCDTCQLNTVCGFPKVAWTKSVFHAYCGLDRIR
jgi:hypothetical protein